MVNIEVSANLGEYKTKIRIENLRESDAFKATKDLLNILTESKN